MTIQMIISLSWGWEAIWPSPISLEPGSTKNFQTVKISFLQLLWGPSIIVPSSLQTNLNQCKSTINHYSTTSAGDTVYYHIAMTNTKTKKKAMEDQFPRRMYLWIHESILAITCDPGEDKDKDGYKDKHKM